MTPQALFILLLTLGAAILLTTERLRPDLVALLVLAILGLSQVVTPAETFSGFSSSAIITILAISIIAEGLRQTGVTNRLGQTMRRLAGASEASLSQVTLFTSAALSLFMNNIAAVGVLLPAVMTLARQTKTSPSRLLMPLAYGTLLGGMATLLTTSNIIVSGTLREAGFEPFGLLTFLPIGLPVVLIGAAYMHFIGRKMLPLRHPGRETLGRAELSRLYDIEKHLCHVEVRQGSALAGQTIQQGNWAQAFGLTVLGMVRNGHTRMAPDPAEIIREGDVLLAQGTPDAERFFRYGLRALDSTHEPSRLADETVILAEVVLAPHATFTGRSLREIGFREKFGFNVLGLWREGKPIQEGISETPLSYGDALLVQGAAGRLPLLKAERDFLVLADVQDVVVHPQKAPLALAITLITLLVATTELLPVAIVTVAGAALLLLSGCLSMDDAYHSVEWKAIFLIAGMWPLSAAIRSSGLAALAVNALLTVFGHPSPLLLAGIILLAALLLTQILGGQVAALVLAPLAISAAAPLQADARALGMAVALGCSLAFITPFGHPVNLLVMSSGGYSVRDFLKVGAPLTILVIVVILTGLHIFWKV